MNISWKQQANCKCVTSLMFAHMCKPSRKPCSVDCNLDRSAVEAKKVCVECPVVAECRFWSVVTALPDGVAGGLTPSERRLMRRRLNYLGFPYKDYKPTTPQYGEEEYEDI